MKSLESLVKQILNEFLKVPFPAHRGLHAAMAMDDWIAEESVLREITQNKDYSGNWWEVPAEDLHKCMMALSYLDAAGIEFYLPAYMKAIIEDPKSFDSHVKSTVWQVVHTMLPNSEDLELAQYFRERFSRIRGTKKLACIEFLKYVASCNAYDRHAREIANAALNSEFWSS